MINRRGLITGLISFVAAPAIVRAGSLMPIKALKLTDYNTMTIHCVDFRVDFCSGSLKLEIGDWITMTGFDRQNEEFIITAISEKDVYVDHTRPIGR